MPEVNGHEVVKTVAATSPDTAIIVVSGTENIDDVALAINHGTWDYILKPITDFRVLLHSVRKNLEKRELVSNSFRHAFPAADKGLIHITLKLTVSIRFPGCYR